MKLKTAILYSFTLACLAMPTFAESAKKKMTNSEKIQMILKKSRTHTMTSFFTTTKKSKNLIIEEQSWRKNSSGALYTKEIITTRNSKTNKILLQQISLFISDSDSIRKGKGDNWDIFGNIAISNTYLIKLFQSFLGDKNMEKIKKKREKYEKKREKYKKYYTYQLKNMVYNGINCYEITYRDNSPILEENEMFMKISIIDKSNYFLYSTRSFLKNGKLSNSNNYQRYKELKKDFFKVPSVGDGFQIYIADTWQKQLFLFGIARDKLRIELNPNKYVFLKNKYKKKYGTLDFYTILTKYKEKK